MIVVPKCNKLTSLEKEILGGCMADESCWTAGLNHNESGLPNGAISRGQAHRMLRALETRICPHEDSANGFQSGSCTPD